MNSNIIKHLAETALKSSMEHDGVYRPDGYAHSVSKTFADEFAKLIIQECCDMIVELRTRPADLAVKDVKKYFGVE